MSLKKVSAPLFTNEMINYIIRTRAHILVLKVRTKNRTHTLVLKFGLTNILVLVNITKERIHICY